MFPFSKFAFAACCVVSLSALPSFAATRESCSLVATKAMVKTIVANSKLKKGAKKRTETVLKLNKNCLKAAAAAPFVQRFWMRSAVNGDILASASVLSTNIRLSYPKNLAGKINIEAVMNGSAPGGIRLIVDKTDRREKGAPFTLFGNEGNTFYPGSITAGTHAMEVRLCSSQSDQKCSTVLFRGTLQVTISGAIIAPTVVPTAPTKATPVPTKPAPSATATPLPAVVNPKPRIDTLNTVVGETITGEAPLSVFVKGITSFSDIPSYKDCLAIALPLSKDGWTYVPVGDPNRSAYEVAGDAKAACLDHVDDELYRLNGQALNYKGNFTTATYNWNFGDNTASSLYNTLDGWNAAHTYNEPGNYKLQLEVIDEQGNKGYKTMAVTVSPSTRRQVYVSNSGSEANDGSSIDKPIKTVAQIAKFTLNKTNFDLLFKRGETFKFTPSDPDITFNKSNIKIGAYGSGDLPKILWTGGKANIGKMIFAFNHNATDVTMENLQFDTDIEGIFGSSDYHEQTSMPSAIRNSGTRILIRNINIRRIGYFIQQMPVPVCVDKVCESARPTGLLVVKNNNPIPDGIRGYFVWNGSGYQVNLLGNNVENSVREHVFRSAAYYELINAQYNSLRNTALADGVDFRKGVFNFQGGGLIHVARNQINEGPSIFAPLGNDRGLRNERTRFGRFVFNKFDVRSTNVMRTSKYGDQTALQIGTGAKHILIANNMFEMSNGIAVTGLDNALSIEGASVDYNRMATDIIIAHNTMSTPFNAVNRQFLQIWGENKDLVLANNLVAHPNIDAGTGSDVPVFISHQGDGITGAIPGLKQLSCNIFPVPAVYKSETFDITKRGINRVNDNFLTVAQWQAKMKPYRQWNGAPDVYKNIDIDRIDFTAMPTDAMRQSIQCPKIAGLNTDFFGTVRKGLTATAGAYEFP